jgi:hypothetical protein
MTALLIGYTTEKTFRHTVLAARETGLGADVLDLALLRGEGTLEIVESAEGLVIRLAGRTFDFDAYGSVYNRAYWTDLGSPTRSAAIGRLVRVLMAWCAFSDRLVVNRPGAGSSNANKFLHGLILQSAGFLTPATALTGDPIQAARMALAEHDLVSKSVSSTKTRTVAMDAGLWARLDRLAVCPSLFQERIRGDEVRAHWIDGAIYAERIATHRVDYRFRDDAAPANTHRMCETPPAIAALCDRYCRSQGLLFAGFDFKVTADEVWVALECNPMPGYESYDRRQDGRISRALCSLLADERAMPPILARQEAYAAPTGWSTDAEAPPRAPYGADIYERGPATGEPDEGQFVAQSRRPETSPFFHDEPLS